MFLSNHFWFIFTLEGSWILKAPNETAGIRNHSENTYRVYFKVGKDQNYSLTKILDGHEQYGI